MLINSPFLKTLSGESIFPRPVWFLRQAGRYLPIYRKFAELIPDFWERCFAPDIASEISTFPIQDFPVDAVIFFSDILTIPHVLGQKIEFRKGEGIAIDNCDPFSLLDNYNINQFHKDLFPVYQGVTMTRLKIGDDIPLIGFAGAPWTLLTYIVGANHNDRIGYTLEYGLKNPTLFTELLKRISDIIAQHLCNQVSAGCDVVQIFDSWAGAVPEAHYDEWLFQPWQRILDKVRAYSPKTPCILFPRSYRGSPNDFAHLQNLTALHLSEDMNIEDYVNKVPEHIVLQGGLDPLALLEDEKTLVGKVQNLLDITRSRPFIMNLGHGVPPEAPLENVRKVIEVVSAYC